MSLDEAMELVQRRRPEANPIPEFMAMLKDYELLQIRSAEGDDVKANNNKRTAAATSPSRPDDAPKRAKPIGPFSRPVVIIGPARPAPESLVGSHETTSYCNNNAVMIGPTTTEGPSESKNDFKEQERNAAQSSSSSSSESSSPSTKRRRIKEDVKNEPLSTKSSKPLI
jgi:hypothetical protein